MNAVVAFLVFCSWHQAVFAVTATTLFSPSKSSSFNSNLFASHPQFANQYADGSIIQGYAFCCAMGCCCMLVLNYFQLCRQRYHKVG